MPGLHRTHGLPWKDPGALDRGHLTIKRILCVGNRHVPGDRAGSLVYERLRQRALPADVELIDGGIAGLNLLRFFEGAERVVLVDSISGYGQPHEVVVLEAAAAAAEAFAGYDHAAGLAYLLRVLPKVCDGPVPQVLLVGIEKDPCDTAHGRQGSDAARGPVVLGDDWTKGSEPDEAAVDRAADLALQLAVGEGSMDVSV